MRSPLPFAALALTATIGALAASPASAATGTAIVYVNDDEGDIWQVQPDGKNAHAVTTDGSKAAPYAHPRLAADGTVWALKGRAVVHVSSGGQPLGSFTPAPLKDSEGVGVDADPEAFDVSPDGTKVLYGVKNIRCDDQGHCNMDSVTGVLDTTGKLAEQDTRFLDGSWWSNTRMIGNDGGAYGEVRLLDLTGPSLLWFDDDASGIPGWSREPALSPDGTQLAVLRTVPGNGHYLMTFKVAAGPAPVGYGEPASLCVADQALGTGTSPTWSPDGRHVVVAAMHDGLAAFDFSAVNVDGDCAKASFTMLTPPHASQPDWDTLPVPDPPVTPPITTTTTTTTAPIATTTTTVPTTTTTTAPPPVTPVAKPAVAVPAQRLKAIVKQGLKVKLSGLPAGKAKVVVKAKGKVVGQATVTVRGGGPLLATVKLTKAGRRSLSRARSASLTIVVGALTKTVKVTS